MFSWLVISTAIVAAPDWCCSPCGQPVAMQVCAPPVAYNVCTPVYSCTPIAVSQGICVEKSVAVETVVPKKEETESQFTAAQESELENVAFNQISPLRVHDMALDWGLANIGPGVLYPITNTISSGGGFVPWGGSNPTTTSSPQSLIINVPGTSTRDPITPPGPGSKEPEPASIMIWGSLGAAGYFASRRRKS